MVLSNTWQYDSHTNRYYTSTVMPYHMLQWLTGLCYWGSTDNDDRVSQNGNHHEHHIASNLVTETSLS